MDDHAGATSTESDTRNIITFSFAFKISEKIEFFSHVNKGKFGKMYLKPNESLEIQTYFDFKCLSGAYNNEADIPTIRIRYLSMVPHSPSHPAVMEKSIKVFQKAARELGLSFTAVTCN